MTEKSGREEPRHLMRRKGMPLGEQKSSSNVEGKGLIERYVKRFLKNAPKNELSARIARTWVVAPASSEGEKKENLYQGRVTEKEKEQLSYWDGVNAYVGGKRLYRGTIRCPSDRRRRA